MVKIPSLINYNYMERKKLCRLAAHLIKTIIESRHNPGTLVLQNTNYNWILLYEILTRKICFIAANPDCCPGNPELD